MDTQKRSARGWSWARRDLCRLGVSAVHEHDGRSRIRQREPPELLRVELAVRVGSHDAADHHEDSDELRVLSQPREGHLPAREPVARLRRPVEIKPHLVGDGGRRISERHAAYEFEGCPAVEQLTVAVPLLSGLAHVYGVEHVGGHLPGDTCNRQVSDRPKVWDRHLFHRRFIQEEEADRRVGLPSKLLELLERRVRVAIHPGVVARESFLPDVSLDAGARSAHRSSAGCGSTRTDMAPVSPDR